MWLLFVYSVFLIDLTVAVLAVKLSSVLRQAAYRDGHYSTEYDAQLSGGLTWVVEGLRRFDQHGMVVLLRRLFTVALSRQECFVQPQFLAARFSTAVTVVEAL